MRMLSMLCTRSAFLYFRFFMHRTDVEPAFFFLRGNLCFLLFIRSTVSTVVIRNWWQMLYSHLLLRDCRSRLRGRRRIIWPCRMAGTSGSFIRLPRRCSSSVSVRSAVHYCPSSCKPDMICLMADWLRDKVYFQALEKNDNYAISRLGFKAPNIFKMDLSG